MITTIDSTLPTPINCRPAEWGIDLVLHSGTKYFAGHSDLICGVAAGRRDLIDQILPTRTTLGCCMDPHAPFCCCAASRRWPSASSARTKARSGLPSSSAGIHVVGARYYPMLNRPSGLRHRKRNKWPGRALF